MIVISIVPPAMLAARNVDIMRALFLCFALALILNVLYGGSDIQINNFKLVDVGFRGYFETKNPLGECASVAFLLSLHEILQRGWRRALGLFVIIVAILLVFSSNSKTAFALALICPLLAWAILLLRKMTRVSPAMVVVSIALSYTLVSEISHYDVMGRISYILYRNFYFDGTHDHLGFCKR